MDDSENFVEDDMIMQIEEPVLPVWNETVRIEGWDPRSMWGASSAPPEIAEAIDNRNHEILIRGSVAYAEATLALPAVTLDDEVTAELPELLREDSAGENASSDVPGIQEKLSDEEVQSRVEQAIAQGEHQSALALHRHFLESGVRVSYKRVNEAWKQAHEGAPESEGGEGSNGSGSKDAVERAEA